MEDAMGDFQGIAALSRQGDGDLVLEDIGEVTDGGHQYW
jgi:hypothetical protein